MNNYYRIPPQMIKSAPMPQEPRMKRLERFYVQHEAVTFTVCCFPSKVVELDGKGSVDLDWSRRKKMLAVDRAISPSPNEES